MLTTPINYIHNKAIYGKFKKNKPDYTYPQDIFEKSSRLSFKGNPKILLFDDVVKAIKTSNLDFIDQLIDPFIINSDLKSLLHISAEHKQFKISQKLLDKGLSLNQKDRFGKTPFSIACASNDEESVNLFLNYKPNINTQDEIGNTPLHEAILCPNILDILLDKGANPYIKNSFGLPVLHEAAENLTTVEYLLKRGINPDSINDEEQTLLHIASIDGKKQLSELLLKYKAEKNFKDKYGKSTLFYAKDHEMVKYWIEKGVDINLQDEEGKTALFDFVSRNDIKSVVELLKNGARTDITDKEGKTILLYANNNIFRKPLLQFGADSNVKTSNGNTLLHSAVRKGHEETVKLLLEYNADAKALDGNDKPPLYYAKSNAIRKLLLENGADPNDDLYLHFALKTNNEEFFNDLLETNIDVNVEDKSSKTPIFYCKRAEDAKKLVNKNAYINYQDDNGNTPLHYYYAMGNAEMIETLEKLGADCTIKNHKGEIPQELLEKYKIYHSWIK